MAAERGLQLVFFCGFHEFYIHQIRSQNNQETWQRMRVLPTDDGSLIFPADQWEAIGLYAVFAFQLATA
jgi:hypothetical protein